jgi:hypothetical protein
VLLNVGERQSLVLPEPTFSLDDVEKAQEAAAAAAVLSAGAAAGLEDTASHHSVSIATHDICLQAELPVVDSPTLMAESFPSSSVSLPSWAELIAQSSIRAVLSQARFFA